MSDDPIELIAVFIVVFLAGLTCALPLSLMLSQVARIEAARIVRPRVRHEVRWDDPELPTRGLRVRSPKD